MKSYNVKSNAKRLSRGLAGKFSGYSVDEPIKADNGEWYPSLLAPQAVLDNGIPDEIAIAAYVNGKAVNLLADETKADLVAVETATEKATDATAPETKKQTRDGSKRKIIAALLLRPEGCTTQDILDATQWPTVTVPGQARSLGITLRQIKEGRNTRYFGTV